jgi:thioredoxin reductase/ferredoxin
MDNISQFLSDIFYLVSINSIDDLPRLLAYIIPFILIWTIYRKIKQNLYKKSAQKLKAVQESGAEPASLHPIIDYNKCLGCATCVTACPEGEILGVVNDKAFLVNPSKCIGHGACKAACPADAITLVFGTTKRGVDIPVVKPNFETNLAGVFIAGELGGMGLIKNAIAQGRQAMESIQKKPGMGKGSALDVVIIGAGPAGFCASLYALEHKMRFITIEQDTLGGTVSNFPRGKVVMTAPTTLPIYGKVDFTLTTKETIMELWEKVAKKTGVKINYKERYETLTQTKEGFIIETNKHKYLTRNVLLAIGRRGTPRKLGVPGENQNKVIYSLSDPAEFVGKHVLVVGGGNSALEAAYSISNENGSTVTISYRSKTFSRAAEKNQNEIKEAEAAGRMNVLMETTVNEIKENSVLINQGDNVIEIPNDSVIVCAGGILPTPMLKKVGIEVETKFGAP